LLIKINNIKKKSYSLRSLFWLSHQHRKCIYLLSIRATSLVHPCPSNVMKLIIMYFSPPSCDVILPSSKYSHHYLVLKYGQCCLKSLLPEFETVEFGLYRMAFSGMLRRVAVGRTDVSEELSASFINVTRIGKLGTTLAATSNRRTLGTNIK
jgi:hypothetical protein